MVRFMSWICSNPNCKKITKGFAQKRTLCWVCQRCKDRMNNKKLKI